MDGRPWLIVFVALVTSRLDAAATCLNLGDGQCAYRSFNRLECAGISGDFPRDEGVRALTLCAHADTEFDVTNVLEYYPNLESFTLADSNVTYVRGVFPYSSTLKVLNFTGLLIEKIRSHVFSSLTSLRVLDLRNNRLKHLQPAVIKIINRLNKLYLEGNQWNCAKNLDWVLYLNASVVQDLQDLDCYGNPFQNKPLKSIAMFIANIRVECPEPCECALLNVVNIPEDRGGGLVPVIRVNCSRRGLKKFPEVLPINTTTVLLDGNQIKNVHPLINNRHYRNVADVYLNNNLITSIDELEGTYWLSHFRVFSLNGNKLSQLPTYALDNALERNDNALHIYLGENPWRCDCFFTPSFQDFLRKYKSLIQDSMDVRCSYDKEDINSLQSILKLSRTDVCQMTSESSIQALDLLNAVLASLLFFILGKLAYDYYNFKKTGQLPWIVTKIP